MIPFSLSDSTISTVKSSHVIGREAFTVKNKVSTGNGVANDKSCAAMNVNGDDEFKITCLYVSEWYAIVSCSSSSLAQQLILFR